MKFKRFVSDYFYVKNDKVFKSAEYQLNDWLNDNPQVVIEDWNICATGKDNVLTIVVKYTEC